MLSINKAILAGNVGADPQIKTMQSGDKVANFSVATKESWKDKATGDWKEATQWHKVVVFNQPSVKFIENNVKKGSQVYIEGQNETRNYDKDGTKVYITEIVVRPFGGEIQLIDKFDSASSSQPSQDSYGQGADDEIPFSGGPDRSQRNNGPEPRQ